MKTETLTSGAAPRPSGRGALPPGIVLAERYRVDALIGEGAMGSVYGAEHIGMRKRVAVKVLHPELSRQPEMVARFEREAMAAARIDHPHAAGASDFGRTPDGSLFLVMEHIEGTLLRDEIDRGPFAVVRAIHVGRQVLEALERAHALGIVHRDVKPENIMLVRSGEDRDFVKLLDFGLARLSAADFPDALQTHAGHVYGTPEYMAPEQAKAQAIDGRTDLYAVGILLYEMLTGRAPFEDDSAVRVIEQQLARKPAPPSRAMPQGAIDPRLDAVILCLLEKKPDARFESARAALNALDAAQVAPDDLHAPMEPGALPLAPVRGSAWRARALDLWDAIEDLGHRARRRSLSLYRTATPLTRSAAGSLLVLVIGTIVLAGVVAGADDAVPAPRGSSPRVDRTAQPPNPPAARAASPTRVPPAADRSGAELQLTVGSALAEGGRLTPAVERFRAALALDPSLAGDARLGEALVLALGDSRSAAEAARLLRDALGPHAVPALVAAARSRRPLLRRNALDLLEEIAPVR